MLISNNIFGRSQKRIEFRNFREFQTFQIGEYSQECFQNDDYAENFNSLNILV